MQPLEQPLANENSYEINLANDTLCFIGSLPDTKIPDNIKPKMRDLVANVVDFQNRFARPMVLPFELGNDFEANLPAPKPLKVLLRFRAAYPLDYTLQNPEFDDGINEEGNSYCFVGASTWQEQVKQGKLTGPDAEPVDVSFIFFKTLFQVLELATNSPLEEKNKARGMAACWYNIVTQVDFSFVPEDEEEEPYDPTPLLENLTLNVGTSMREFIQDPDLLGSGDSDSSYADDGDEKSDESQPSGDADDEEGSGSQEEEDSSNSQDEDDDLPPLVTPVASAREITPLEVEVREVVFRVVTSLSAFMPNPNTQLVWFKRVLKHIRTVQASGDDSWYPWGCPPMVPLIECLKGQDPFAKEMAGAIIMLFQQQLQQESN